MNAPNPFVGVVYHWIGGLAAASFYIPYRRVKEWAWETYWLVGGVFSWLIAPWLLASLLVPNLTSILLHADRRTLLLALFFGVIWGIGGLTFGLSMRYLGIALGYAVALGLCAAFGTLVPPIVSGEIGKIAGELSGRVMLSGVMVCLVGIAISGMAGRSKEAELPKDLKLVSISEFDFRKGILMAMFAGIMSACFAYGLAAGKPIALTAKAELVAGAHSDLWQNLPVLVVVLWGGFATNFVWCLALNLRNRTGCQYVRTTTLAPTKMALSDDSSEDGPENCVSSSAGLAESTIESAPPPRVRVPLLANYLFCALAGVTWYMQFFFYSMGQTRMGKYDFSSWTLHMASIIIFSTLWGVALKEWRGTSRRTHLLIAAGLAVLIASTIVVGYGNYLKVVTVGAVQSPG